MNSELWIIGIVFLKLAKHLTNQKKINFFRLLQFISEGETIECLNISRNGWDILKKLLSKNPKERISAQIALSHEWFYNQKA